MTVPVEEAPANFVPAAALIRRGLALLGMTGRKGRVGAHIVRREIPGLNLGAAFDTCELEDGRGSWNSQCRGEIRRYWEEHRWRRRRAGPLLTLRRESVGSKQD